MIEGTDLTDLTDRTYRTDLTGLAGLTALSALASPALLNPCLTDEQSVLGPPPRPELLSCEDEEIRIPGSIQAHGFLLLLDEQLEHIVAASENAAEFLGMPLKLVLGASLGTCLDQEAVSAVRAISISSDPTGLVNYVGAFRVQGKFFSLVAHNLSGRRVLEFEKLDRLVSPEMINTVITNFVGKLGKLNSEHGLCLAITKQIKDLTGFNRILLYSFDESGHGTVLTEENDGVLPSYMDLRFPASDIPRQARALYVLNTMRFIPNATYEPSLLQALPGMATAKLDLSQSVLRSVSPIHLEYMRNMGTLASMSFSIICDGELWGLVSAHDAAPRNVPFLIRSACDLLTRMVGTQLRAYRSAAQLQKKVHFHTVHRRILTQMAAETNYVAGIEQQVDDFMDVTNAEGVALLIGSRVACAGKTPDETALARIAKWLDKKPGLELFESRELGRELGPDLDWVNELSDVASGMLAIRVSDVKRNYILWFRPEVVRTVKWAGEPIKPESTDYRVHPRLSFASWQETVRGKSTPWTEMEIESASEFRTAVQKIILKRAEEAEQLSEARFQQLTHAIPTLVWTADDEGNLTYVNQRWREQGLKEQGRWFEAGEFVNGDVKQCHELWQAAVAEGTLFEEEFRLRTGTSIAERWNLVRAVPFKKADGTRAGWVGTCTDLTDRREREHALRMTEKLAVMERMTSVIAHEINNPLEAMTNLLFLLRGSTAGDDSAQQYLGMAENELERISGITKQTLRWNRENVHRPEWTSAGYLFEDIIRLFAGKILSRGVTVKILGGEEVPVYGVVGQLRQVLANLVSNALDAVPVGGHVRLEAQKTEEGSKLIVTDAGVGMSMETQKQIFQPFYSTKGDLGNGLGLYISHEIIQRHGGSFGVESEIGKGTTVLVRLPSPTQSSLI